MKNTGKHFFVARKIVEKLTERLSKESEPLYADWLISLMREGFSKTDAVKAFRKSDFTLLEDGTIKLKKNKPLFEREKRKTRYETSYEAVSAMMAQLDEIKKNDYSRETTCKVCSSQLGEKF